MSSSERRLPAIERMETFGIIGTSRCLVKAVTLAERAATLDAIPILLVGETGTGKELLAAAIHKMDPRRSSRPFVPVNCGALTRELFESELFGHRRGAFTGAYTDQPGLIRSCNGGVLFLDEIGELPSFLQSKLLRVVQEKRVLPIGQAREVPVDFRIISATNQPLSRLRDGGCLRNDLYHRLSGVVIRLPPLRERHGDHQRLAEHFVSKHRKNFPPNPELRVGADFLRCLKDAPLRGNVRELEHLTVMAMASASSEDGLLRWRHVLNGISGIMHDSRGDSPAVSCGTPHPSTLSEIATVMAKQAFREGADLAESVRTFRTACVNEALRRSQGNKTVAAKILGVSSRTVYNLLCESTSHTVASTTVE